MCMAIPDSAQCLVALTAVSPVHFVGQSKKRKRNDSEAKGDVSESASSHSRDKDTPGGQKVNDLP